MIRLSLVIATYNRAGLLTRTLQALATQRVEPDVDYEVIFVDDGSTDDTGALITSAAASCDRLRYLRLDHTGSPGGPRNAGMRAATGEIIILIDDDVVPDAEFVQAHAAFHQAHQDEAEAALGELYLDEATRRDPMSLFHAFPYHEAAQAQRLSYLFFWTCNVSLKSSFMLRYGMFDEDAALHPLEDMECGYRLFQAGLRLRFLPAARGCHLHQLRPDAIERKGRRTGQAQAALVRRVPDLALQRRFGILTPEQPWPLRLLRRTRRLAFTVVDNPISHLLLRSAGAAGATRSRWSDAYYYLRFRRAMVEGFREARSASPAVRS
jgi:glycosyltransferase involved in cell wall biosynthesis